MHAVSVDLKDFKDRDAHKLEDNAVASGIAYCTVFGMLGSPGNKSAQGTLLWQAYGKEDTQVQPWRYITQ